MEERAADVEVTLPSRHKKKRGSRVDCNSQGGDDDDRDARHGFRVGKPLNRFPRDPAGREQQKRPVGQRGKN